MGKKKTERLNTCGCYMKAGTRVLVLSSLVLDKEFSSWQVIDARHSSRFNKLIELTRRRFVPIGYGVLREDADTNLSNDGHKIICALCRWELFPNKEYGYFPILKD